MSLSRSWRPRRRAGARPGHAAASPLPAAHASSVEPAAPTPISPDQRLAIEASPFTSLGLASPLVRAVLDEGYLIPTPIQTGIIPHVLAGRDVLACAQTGTGKTAAFVLPMLQRLDAEPTSRRAIRALVLTPTRELAAQIGESVTAYGRHLSLGCAVIYGGVGQARQERALATRPDVLIATPGRLRDLLNQGLVELGAIEYFVLDEADRMLDMGFITEVRRIAALLPDERRTLLFSATMAPAIASLANRMLHDPVRLTVAPTVTTAPTIDQSVIFVAKEDKRTLLESVLKDDAVTRALVFTRTKHGASRLSKHLARAGIDSVAIHGDKSQSARESALGAFRSGASRVMVATDVAARGIDVDGVSHVINFDVPNIPESYVHRIGRTGRAGAVGHAICFCDRDERALLADIERLIRMRLPSRPTSTPGVAILERSDPDPTPPPPARRAPRERSHRIRY